MPNGRPATRAKQRTRRTQVNYWQHVTALLSQRDQLIDEILVCSRAQAPSPFIKKADALLTRFWAKADWKAREEILRTARWLVDVGRNHAPTATKKARARKAGQRGPAASAGNAKQGRLEANVG